MIYWVWSESEHWVALLDKYGYPSWPNNGTYFALLYLYHDEVAVRSEGAGE